MKLIFLDIDGVLNDHTRFENGYCGIQREPVEQLNRILAAVPDAQIVISSAWRYMIHCRPEEIKWFENLLLTHGINCYGRLISCTISDEEQAGEHDMDWWRKNGIDVRVDQIDQYLMDHYEYVGVFEWVVLDDMDLPIQRFVRTSGNVGLTRDNADQAIAILQGAGRK